MAGDSSPALFITADGLQGDSQERSGLFLCLAKDLSNFGELFFFHKYYIVTRIADFRKLQLGKIDLLLLDSSSGGHIHFYFFEKRYTVLPVRSGF